MNNYELAYRLGQQAAMEKHAAFNIMNKIRQGGTAAMKYLGTKGSKYGLGNDKFQRGAKWVGRNTLGDGAFLGGGLVNVGLTRAMNPDASFGDYARSFAIGGATAGFGWRGATNVGKRLAAPMGRTSARNLNTHLRAIRGPGSKNNFQIAKAYGATLKKGLSPEALKSNQAAYKELLKANTTLGQRMQLGLATNKRGIAGATAAFGTGMYLTSKGTTAVNNLLDGPVPYNNNPYS